MLTTALAQRGFNVTALVNMNVIRHSIDARAKDLGLDHRLHAVIGNVQHLQFANGAFDVVLAVGVLGWVKSPLNTMIGIRRILRRGGCAIVTIDNRWTLAEFLDPRRNPVLKSFYAQMAALIAPLCSPNNSLTPSFPNKFSVKKFDDLVRGVGMMKLAGFTITFGPFTFLGHNMFPDHFGMVVHDAFQRLADFNLPPFRFGGSDYVYVGLRT